MGYDDGRRRQRTETPHSLVAVIFHVSGAFNEVPHAPVCVCVIHAKLAIGQFNDFLCELISHCP